jgi:ABC-type cobalt transport system substrate-binding protein
VTTLAGTALGGGISYFVGRQQAKDARSQRDEEYLREQRKQSADRRFQAYSGFLNGARSFRNGLETYYAHPRNEPSLAEIESLLHTANDASTLVFLVVESPGTYQACRDLLRALSRAGLIIRGSEPGAAADPWAELDTLLGKATREFQNAARNELGVPGPAEPWDSPAFPS